MDKFLAADYSEVVISSGGKKDPEALQKFHLSDNEEKEIRKKFRKLDEKPKILIVTEKLLTGFDAPILYCMYLDKPMRDHVLLQAIARVNRPYEDEDGRRKPAGFVLDFVGIFDKLEKALAFDSDDVKGVIEGLDVLKDRFVALMDQGRSKYLPILAGKTGDKAVEAVLEYFRDKETRHEFYEYCRELQEVYEIISPDAFLRPYMTDYEELARMYHVVRANYERGVLVDKSFLRKTAKLVQEHTQTGEIRDPEDVYKLNAATLEKLASAEKPDTVKIFNLLKALDEMVRVNAQHEPYLINIGERAQQIAEAFEDRQKTTQDALDELQKLLAEVKEAEKQRDETRLSPEAFAVYWLLKKEGVKEAQRVAESVGKAFDQHPHWQTSSHQEQEVRRSLYKAFIDAGVKEAVVETAQGIMRMLRKATQ